MHRLDETVAQHANEVFALLAELVRADSTVGHEQAAEEVLAAALEQLGFTVERLPIPEGIGADPLAGVPQQSYAGRYDLVARRPGSDPSAPSLLLNGHIDVVPVEDADGWTSPPFAPEVRDGWLFGRGAGDMKCGFAMCLLAIRALDEVQPGWQRGDLTLIAVIEEECTGNGALASIRAGVTADAAVLLEPTDLELLLAGIAIAWIEVVIEGRAGHAEASGRSGNPILAAEPVLAGLRWLETRMNADHRVDPDPAFADIESPYLVNVGRFTSGSWASSVPQVARIDVRVGHPAAWSAEQTLEQVRTAIAAASHDDSWLGEHPPTLRLNGYRAERYAQDPDDPFVRRFAAAHEAAHGSTTPSVSIGATTDARYYVNQAGIPALAYGPRVQNMHGVDEAVELASVVDGARTLARFLADYLGEERA
ncbi:M20/M25/M40 family metallo-hydrolase [Amnibacterium kyonggiense]|uniref:Acetylornithine deacetylase n=1 Tax=Amnibacterium kyonggiense TaxID=595671 RepID=A0A4R7FLJ2_9MICO|nr:M20/M25/M40 family metallo-hydrolase [Amnibacterium kyonggiense]TDS77246.1 acetylornithine deacetylase [Amnibacterium kyonggiense]